MSNGNEISDDEKVDRIANAVLNEFAFRGDKEEWDYEVDVEEIRRLWRGSKGESVLGTHGAREFESRKYILEGLKSYIQRLLKADKKEEVIAFRRLETVLWDIVTDMRLVQTKVEILRKDIDELTKFGGTKDE